MFLTNSRMTRITWSPRGADASIAGPHPNLSIAAEKFASVARAFLGALRLNDEYPFSEKDPRAFHDSHRSSRVDITRYTALVSFPLATNGGADGALNLELAKASCRA